MIVSAGGSGAAHYNCGRHASSGDDETSAAELMPG